MYEDLARDDDPTGAVRQDLAGCYHQLGVLNGRLGHHEEALHSFERARRIRQDLLRAYPGDTRFLKDLAGSANNIGMLLAKLGQPGESLRNLQQACDLRAQLARDHPSEAGYRADLTWTLGNLAVQQSAMGRDAEAEAVLKRARDLAEAVVRELPEAADARSTLAGMVYGNLASLLRRRGEFLGAVRYSQLALEIQERLVHDNPAVVQYRMELATTYYNRGNLYYEMGRLEDSLSPYRRSSEVMEGLVLDHPGDPKFQSGLADCLAIVGDRLLEAGQAAEARDWHGRAVALREVLARTAPDDLDRQLDLANDLGRFGMRGDALGPPDRGRGGPPSSDRRAGQGGWLGIAEPRRIQLLAELSVELAACLASLAGENEAVELVRQAVELGFDDRARLAAPAFASLRARPDFQALWLDFGFPSDPFAP